MARADSGEAAATFGGSAAVQAAIEGTKTAAEGAGWRADCQRSFGCRRIHAEHTEFGAARRPIFPLRRGLRPPRLGKAENPSNPAQVAHQTEPHSFTVTDEVRGTISHHKGNIFAPYAAQAAFNAFLEGATKRTAAAAATKQV